jgi:hypothetical protein
MRTTGGAKAAHGRWRSVLSQGRRALSMPHTMRMILRSDLVEMVSRFEVLEVRPSECLRLKEDGWIKGTEASSRIAKLRLRANLAQRVKCPMT